MPNRHGIHHSWHLLDQATTQDHIKTIAWRLAQVATSGERFIAFKELLINNGLSNARAALRSALAVALLTNRTLVMPKVCRLDFT